MPNSERGPVMARILGSVKWFNNVKGFGFLGQEGGPGRIRSLQLY